MDILNYGGHLGRHLEFQTYSIACWKGCPPRSCCRRSKESNHT